MVRRAGRAEHPQGLLNAKPVSQLGGLIKRELDSNIYRADPSGRVDMVISEGSRQRRQRHHLLTRLQEGVLVARGGVVVTDVTPQNKLANPKLFPIS